MVTSDRKRDGPLVRARRRHSYCPFSPWDFGTSRWQLRIGRYTKWCRPKCGWNYKWHNLRETNYSMLCGEFKGLIDGLCGKALPAIDFAHVDLAGSKQRPEQHGSRVRRRQHGLRLDSALELLV